MCYIVDAHPWNRQPSCTGSYCYDLAFAFSEVGDCKVSAICRTPEVNVLLNQDDELEML